MTTTMTSLCPEDLRDDSDDHAKARGVEMWLNRYGMSLADIMDWRDSAASYRDAGWKAGVVQMKHSGMDGHTIAAVLGVPARRVERVIARLPLQAT